MTPEKIKTFLFYYNRFETATTSLRLSEEGIPHNVLVHDEEAKRQFIKEKTVTDGNFIVTNQPKGLSYQRNHALDSMETGDWAMFLVDDFVKFKTVPHEHLDHGQVRIKATHREMNQLRARSKMTWTQFYEHCLRYIAFAEKHNKTLCGFGSHENPMNLQRAYSEKSLVDGRAYLVKKTRIRNDTNVNLSDDMQFTAEHIIRKASITWNWVIPVCRRYTKGGCGTVAERLQQRIAECRYLVAKYHPVIQFKQKPGWPQGSHIAFFASDANIKKTRERMGIR